MISQGTSRCRGETLQEDFTVDEFGGRFWWCRGVGGVSWGGPPAGSGPWMWSEGAQWGGLGPISRVKKRNPTFAETQNHSVGGVNVDWASLCRSSGVVVGIGLGVLLNWIKSRWFGRDVVDEEIGDGIESGAWPWGRWGRDRDDVDGEIYETGQGCVARTGSSCEG